MEAIVEVFEVAAEVVSVAVTFVAVVEAFVVVLEDVEVLPEPGKMAGTLTFSIACMCYPHLILDCQDLLGPWPSH